MHKFKLLPLVLVFVIVIGAYNGNTEKAGYFDGLSRSYEGFTQFGNWDIWFYASVDTAIFLLTSVENKYKVIQIRVENRGDKLLRLSDQKDMVTVVFNNTKIKGILDIYERDSAFWDALAPETRKILAYPENVLAHEEESVFVFVPEGSSDGLPSELRYRIATLPNEIVIGQH